MKERSRFTEIVDGYLWGEALSYKLYLAVPLVLPRNFVEDSFSVSLNSLPIGLEWELVVMGIRYHQEVDGVMYLLHVKDGAGISLFLIKH
ncbi:hypothetical protein [Xanthomarina sp.]|uniref:hypothetical protein n=1 Tax=Xanthomarina sp. TaxID=1931211 RepID=UPI002C277357|nr:hypothetical protein [Xanthomarina sp.]HLV39349.1 hypothetical protein [Xanthomarina sp.]